MTYVDGFVIPVQKGKLAQYRKMAKLGARVWTDHGALDYKECVAQDLHAEMPDETGRMKRVPSLFPSMVKAKPGETIIFAYIVYRNKAHRDAVNKKVFADPRMANMSAVDMPVDMARMATAGFKTLVEASAGSATGRRRRAPRRSNGARPRTPVSRPEVVWSR